MKLPVVVILILLDQSWASFVRRACPDVCECYPDPETQNGVIDCSGRGLTTMPDILYPHYPSGGRIAKIDFSDNLLTTLDIEQLYKLIRGTRLDILDFSNNRISEVIGSFSSLEGTEYVTLNLSRNGFTSFPTNVVPVSHGRSKLILDFSYNQLTALPARMFAGTRDNILYGVQFLARDNFISRIDDEAFQGVKLTETILDLRYNQLTNLSSDFQPPSSVQEIRLSNNPWDCDCNLRWIIDPSRQLINYTASDPPSCEEPAPLQGRPIFSLERNEFACSPYLEGSRTIEIVGQEAFTLTCPVTADPPNPEITWTVWIPNPGQDPTRLDLVLPEITVPSDFGAAFRCTASNIAGNVTLDLDVRYNGEPGIPIPEGE